MLTKEQTLLKKGDRSAICAGPEAGNRALSVPEKTGEGGAGCPKTQDGTGCLNMCGIEQWEAGNEVCCSAQAGTILHVVAGGKGTLKVNGKTHAIHDGQIFVLRGGQEAVYSADRSEPWRIIWICLQEDDAEQYLQEAGFTEEMPVVDCRIEASRFARVVEEMMTRPGQKKSDELLHRSQILRFLSYAVESWENASEGKERRRHLSADEYMNLAVHYIEVNYMHIRIGDVAGHLGLSRSYFAEIFRRKMNISPQDFLMQVRMEKAVELLEKTRLPIATVASGVGYEDQLAFSKMFRKKNGVSPEQYRKLRKSDT